MADMHDETCWVGFDLGGTKMLARARHRFHRVDVGRDAHDPCGAVAARVDLRRSEWLFVVTPLLSNLVSNVPAVMLLLPASTGLFEFKALCHSPDPAANKADA